MDELKPIAERIRADEERRQRIALQMKASRGMVRPVKREPLDGVVAGIDGGLVTKPLHGFDIIVVRACAAVMRFKDGALAETSYVPASYVDPKVMVQDSENDAASLIRMAEEITLARDVLEKQGPDYVLLDGSIMPSHVSASLQDSEEYKRVIGLYSALLESSRKNDIPVIGVVEDSRASTLATQFGEKSADTVLLHYVLGPGERTAPFPFSRAPATHAVLKDFDPKIYNNLKAFYVRPVRFDRPLRVEYYDYGVKDEDVASLVASLSDFNPSYGFPCVLVEADLQAKLAQSELDDIIRQLEDDVGETSAFMFKRRDSRPF